MDRIDFNAIIHRLRPLHYPATVVAMIWAWSATASYIYLVMRGFSADFEFPWLQWWVALPYIVSAQLRSLDGLNMVACFAFAGLAPSFVIAGGIKTVWRSRREALYGSAEWTEKTKLRGNGLDTRRRPF